MDDLKRAKIFFLIVAIIGITISVIVSSFGYYWSGFWFGLAVAFLIVYSVAIYSRKITAKYRLDDERARFIEEKAGNLAFKVAFISAGFLMAIIIGLENFGLSIPASAVIAPYFAFIGVFHLIIYRHYEKMY